MIICDT